MGQRFDVTTHFFATALVDPAADAAPVTDASYLEGTCWLPLADVTKALAFDRIILAAVQRLIPAAAAAGMARPSD
jgi:hypothetical protein